MKNAQLWLGFFLIGLGVEVQDVAAQDPKPQHPAFSTDLIQDNEHPFISFWKNPSEQTGPVLLLSYSGDLEPARDLYSVLSCDPLQDQKTKGTVLIPFEKERLDGLQGKPGIVSVLGGRDEIEAIYSFFSKLEDCQAVLSCVKKIHYKIVSSSWVLKFEKDTGKISVEEFPRECTSQAASN